MIYCRLFYQRDEEQNITKVVPVLLFEKILIIFIIDFVLI